MPCLLSRSDNNGTRAVTVNVWNMDQSAVDKSLLEVSLNDLEEPQDERHDSFDLEDTDSKKNDNTATDGSDEMISARERVFDCTELHEQILVKLPPRYILRAQRVAHSWRHIAASSPCLRQALFLEPAKPALAWTLSDGQSTARVESGTTGLLGPAATLMVLDRLLPIAEAQEEDVPYITQAKVNGLLPYRHLHFSQPLDSEHASWAFCNYMHPDGPPAETAFSTSIDGLKRMHTDHQAMLLSQPPTKLVDVCVYGGKCRALIETIACEDDMGVTIGQVLRAVGRVQSGTAVRCTEVGIWMKDVTFVRRKAVESTVAS